MAKQYDQPIDINTNWNGDESTGGLPVAGKRVREFLQDFLQNLATSKIGCYRLQTNDNGTATLRAFASEANADLWQQNPEANRGLVLSEVSFYSQPVQDDYTLTARVTKNPDNPMIKGASNTVSFTYNSYYGGDVTDLDTEKGYAKVLINNTEIKQLGLTLDPGGNEYTIDLGNYLTQENNTVRLEIGNQHGKTRSWTFTIQAVEIILGLDSSYDESLLRAADWRLRVACRGVTAQVHMAIDGTEVGQSTITNSTYDFPVDERGTLTPGTHTITLYAENADYGIRSETISTSFIKAGLSTPSICIGREADKAVTLYDTAVIPYFLHYPGAGGQQLTVSFEVQDEAGLVLDTPTPQAITLNADGTSGMQEWRCTIGKNQYLTLGRVVLVVRIGNVRARHTIQVRDAGVILEPASECKVYLSAAGRTNADSDAETWHSEYNNETTCTVVRSANFKLTGENGFNNDAYVIKAGKRITLAGYRPFASDFGANAEQASHQTGRTIEFEFETKNCTNSDAKVIECLDGGVGFVIYANKVELHSENGTIETYYSDEKRMRVGFAIDGTTTHCVNKLIDGQTESYAKIAYLYVNGVIVRMMDYGTSSWAQPNPKEIIIGSDDCQVNLYTVRGFDKSLNYQQMLGNYAYDTPSLADKIAIAKRNNVLDSSNAVDFAKTLAALPNTPYIIWEMPKVPTSKKDKQKTNTEYHNPQWPGNTHALAPFDCLQHDTVLDGTSSLSYPEPYKNWGATYNGTWTIHLGAEDLIITSYSITPGIEDGEKDFVHKVNFASSEGIFNILAMNAYQEILLATAQQYPALLTAPQAAQQSRGATVTYRHSLSGHPEIGWLRTYTNGNPSVRFLSIYNFINNKYSASIFGLDNSGENEVWEVEDNVNFFMEQLDQGRWDSTAGEYKDRATTLYYARIPKKSPSTGADYGKAANAQGVTQANTESSKLRAFHNWVQSCNPSVAERYRLQHGAYRQLPRAVTYGDTTYTYDTKAYRLAKFNAEYAAHGLVKESAIFYFIFTVYLLGVDSLDKNMSIAIIQALIYFFLRDSDTLGMFGNRGTLLYKVFHEWNDSYDESTGTTGVITGETYNPDTQAFTVATTAGSPVFNARLSGLWDCVVGCWGDDIKSMYQAMRSNGLNAENLMRIFDEFWSQWSEALYNADGMGYANTGNFNMAQGDKRELMRYFFKYRQRYWDSKCGANTSKALVLRLWGSGAGVALRHYCPLYASLNWGAGGIKTVRSIRPGEPAYFESTGANFNETTFTVYDADLLTEISTYTELPNGTVQESGLQDIATSCDIPLGLDHCTRLQKLILDFSTKAPNTNLTYESLAGIRASIALKELVVRNCPNVNGALELSSEQLERVDLRGTPVTGLTMPETDSLTTLHLGAGLKTLRLSGYSNLDTLTAEGFEQLTTLDISGCPNADTRSILEDALAAESRKLTSVRMHDISWQNFSPAYLERLADMHADLTGDIALVKTGVNAALVNFDFKRKLLETWGNIDDPGNPLRIDYAQRSIGDTVTISGQRYISEPGQYRLGVTPYNPNGNNFVDIKWGIQTNNYATIDENTGVLTVSRVGTEDRAPKAKVTVTVTLTDGETLTDTVEIGFYNRSCQLGDYVYADGSFSDVLDSSKTVVGICFYINPANRSQRLCVMPQNLTSYPWGLYSGDNNNGIQGITLNDTVGYNVYDIPTMNNIGNRGINGSYVNESSYRDETTSGDADGFKVPDTGSAMGEIGFTRLQSKLGKYEAGTELPYGLVNTLRIINHRNTILHDSAVNLPIPQAIEGVQTLYQNLIQCMYDVVANNGNQGKYRQYYYPPASMCNAYQPGTRQGEQLADCFKAGKWFLPSEGELSRLYWWHRQGYSLGNENAIFAEAKDKGRFTQFPNSEFWSSTENSQNLAWTVNFSDGNTNYYYGYGNKYFSCAVRAVAAF